MPKNATSCGLMTLRDAHHATRESSSRDESVSDDRSESARKVARLGAVDHHRPRSRVRRAGESAANASNRVPIAWFRMQADAHRSCS